MRQSLIADIVDARRAGDSERSAVMVLEGMIAAVFTFLSGRQLTALAAPGCAPGTTELVVFGAALRPLAVTAVTSGNVQSPNALRGLLSSVEAA